MGGAARATSSAPSAPRRAPPSPGPTRAAAPATGWPSWSRSRAGCRGGRAGRRHRRRPEPPPRHRRAAPHAGAPARSEEHTSELQSLTNLVYRLLLEKKKQNQTYPLLQNKKKQKHNTSNKI